MVVERGDNVFQARAAAGGSNIGRRPKRHGCRPPSGAGGCRDKNLRGAGQAAIRDGLFDQSGAGWNGWFWIGGSLFSF